MVTAELKDVVLWGGDGRRDAEVDDPVHFGVRAQLFIGELGNNLADSFDVVVCSASWLAEEVAAGRTAQFAGELIGDMAGDVLPGAGVWLMQRWDREAFESNVRLVCATLSPGPDWGSVASRISRLIPWEYDYRYDEFVDEHYGEAYPPRP